MKEPVLQSKRTQTAIAGVLVILFVYLADAFGVDLPAGLAEQVAVIVAAWIVGRSIRNTPTSGGG